MATEKVLKPEEEALGSAMSKTEQFFEENSKKVIYVLVALLVVAAVVFGCKKLVSEPRAQKAAEMIAEAQYRFESATPDYELALYGDENGAGFADVVDSYGSTPAGNLAKHYAGICCLRLGDLDKAQEYLAKYSPVKGIPGAVINAQNYGLQGDVYVQKGDYSKAADLYRKAVEAADNVLTTPAYLKKLGLVYEKTGDRAAALKAFNRIADEYPMSIEAREAGKFIGAAEQE